MQHKLTKPLFSCLLVFLINTTGQAEENTETAGERCITLSHIKQVKVLDSQRILFRLSGNRDYLNILPHPCPGLRKQQPFMYRTSLPQLCDLDMITVLDSGAFGLRPLGSCGLGRFLPVQDPATIPIEGALGRGDQAD